MAVVNGDNYTYVDIVNDGTTTRHMIEDSDARGDISELKSAFDATIDDNNLFVLSTTTDGKRLNTSGVPQTAADYYITL